MKLFCTAIAIGLSLSAAAQKTEQYYDYYWKPCTAENARYFSTVEKTDSGWFRNDYFLNTGYLQMQALYEDKDNKIQNGYYSYFYANGQASSIGRRVHGKREGVCVQYHSNGMMSDSATFHADQPVGARFHWHRNGYQADSTNHVNDSMDVSIGWFDNGNVSYAGYLLYGKKTGKWKYYHRNGQLSGEEVFNSGNVVSKTFYNEDGSAQPDTSKANRDARFTKGGEKGWLSYLYKNMFWPNDYQLSATGIITVGVSFTINEEGKPEDIEMSVPFHPAFDKIAMDIIRRSPPWIPALSNNRRVKAYFNQPVSFQQE